MHDLATWEASRSGAGIALALTAADGRKQKVAVKKIVGREDGDIAVYNSDGSSFLLHKVEIIDGGDTSAEVASIAGELMNLDASDFDTLDAGNGSLAAEQLIDKIKTVAASALGQRP